MNLTFAKSRVHVRGGITKTSAYILNNEARVLGHYPLILGLLQLEERPFLFQLDDENARF